MFDSDLFYFPFLSSVWGSVSDWALILVTAFTLYFLRKTLKSQLKVQELQLKNTLIENERYRMEHIPKFHIEALNTPYIKDEFEYHTEIILKFELLVSHIKECSIEVISDNSILYPSNKNVYSTTSMGKNYTHELMFRLKSTHSSLETDGMILKLNIKFTDPVSNKYIQQCDITFFENRTVLSIDDIPQLLSI